MPGLVIFHSPAVPILAFLSACGDAASVVVALPTLAPHTRSIVVLARTDGEIAGESMDAPVEGSVRLTFERSSDRIEVFALTYPFSLAALGLSSGPIPGTESTRALPVAESIFALTPDGSSPLDAIPSELSAVRLSSLPHSESPTGRVTSAVTGLGFTCIATESGSVFCSGDNRGGTLGREEPEYSAEPLRVPLVPPVRHLSAGNSFVCALTYEGEVWCWGGNSYGQLGRQTLRGRESRPEAVTGLVDVVAVEAGNGHACATRTSGALLCWGNNRNQQVAGPGPNEIGTATPVPLELPVIDTCAAAAHTCALHPDGTLSCFGSGQLGAEAPNEREFDPRRVAGLPSVERVDCAGAHTCVQGEGGAFCFGSNAGGEFSGPDRIEYPEPIPVELLRGTEIFAGERATCSRGAMGLVCAGASIDAASDPIASSLEDQVGPVSELSLGLFHACAIADASPWCWGLNGRGELGVASNAVATVPVTVPGVSVQTLALGPLVSCATSSSATFCFGNHFGLLGGASGLLFEPTRVDLGIYSSVSFGSSYACGIDDSGGVACWGSNVHGELGDPTWPSSPRPTAKVPGIAEARRVVAGRKAACALLHDGSVWCWGSNKKGTLGDGSGEVRDRPVRAALPEPIVDLELEAEHACALGESRRVYCWGANDSAEARRRQSPFEVAPFEVSGAAGAIDVAVGGHHSCARLEGGVYCWGNGSKGQTGAGVEDTTFEPVRVPFEGVISGLALGDDFTCGLTAKGSVFCFGENDLGQTGTGSAEAVVTAPTRVQNLPRILVIDAGNDHACAIVEGNSLTCWGSGTHGQLGQGDTGGFFDAPRPYPVPE